VETTKVLNALIRNLLLPRIKCMYYQIASSECCRDATLCAIDAITLKRSSAAVYIE